MTKPIIKTGTEAEFFQRGRQLAQAADRGERLPDSHVITLEDTTDQQTILAADLTPLPARKPK